MKNTIPQKALVAIPDFANPASGIYKIVPPQEAFVPAFDRSFHFGDSIYEVIRTYEGIPFTLNEHLKRLKNSAELGMYGQYINESVLRSAIIDLIRTFYNQFGNMDVYVRITVSRGFGDLNIDPGTAGTPYALVFVKELEKIKPLFAGMHFAIVERRRNAPNTVDPAMKSGNYLNNILALAAAVKMGAQDALMLSHDGFVTEGTTNNFYIVKSGAGNNSEIWTPPLSIGILAGITRDIIFQVCKANGLPVKEKLFTQTDVLSAEEAFFSSSTKEVVPITKINQVQIANGKPGPLTMKVHGLLLEWIQNYIKTHLSESLYR